MIRRAFSSSAVLAGRTIKYQNPVAQRKQDQACVEIFNFFHKKAIPLFFLVFSSQKFSTKKGKNERVPRAPEA